MNNNIAQGLDFYLKNKKQKTKTKTKTKKKKENKEKNKAKQKTNKQTSTRLKWKWYHFICLVLLCNTYSYQGGHYDLPKSFPLVALKMEKIFYQTLVRYFKFIFCGHFGEKKSEVPPSTVLWCPVKSLG